MKLVRLVTGRSSIQGALQTA